MEQMADWSRRGRRSRRRRILCTQRLPGAGGRRSLCRQFHNIKELSQNQGLHVPQERKAPHHQSRKGGSHQARQDTLQEVLRGVGQHLSGHLRLIIRKIIGLPAAIHGQLQFNTHEEQIPRNEYICRSDGDINQSHACYLLLAHNWLNTNISESLSLIIILRSITCY